MKRAVNILIVLLLLAGTMFSVKWFIDTDYFKIQEVVIQGESKLLKQDIVAQLENMKGKNIVYIDTVKIENLIKKDARVKKISIKKQFPGKIEVTLEERQPYVYIKKGDETFLADENLNIYGDILEDPSRNIPIVHYTSDESLNEIKKILSKIGNKGFYDTISEIRQSEKNYEILLINNVKIITDTVVTNTKYDESYKLYEKIKKTRTVTYMDLRFKDIVVK